MEENGPCGISGSGVGASDRVATGVRRGSCRRMSRRDSAMGSVDCEIRLRMWERADVEMKMVRLSSE